MHAVLACKGSSLSAVRQRLLNADIHLRTCFRIERERERERETRVGEIKGSPCQECSSDETCPPAQHMHQEGCENKKKKKSPLSIDNERSEGNTRRKGTSQRTDIGYIVDSDEAKRSQGI